MFIFIDETWQEVDGTPVGALGGVAIARDLYNPFARDFFAQKRNTLGSRELRENEIKGNNCFARRQFERRAESIDAKWLDAAEQILPLLERYGARVFGIWTTNPDLLSLRLPDTTEVTAPYKQMLFDIRAFMEREAPLTLASLKFDQRRPREDSATACCLANYVYRTQNALDQSIVGIPDFTVSAVTPGLQIADLVTYLVAQNAAPTARPELGPYLDVIEGRAYEYVDDLRGREGRTVRTIRRVAGRATRSRA